MTTGADTGGFAAGAGGFSDLVGGLTGIFGGSETVSGSGTTEKTGVTTERLQFKRGDLEAIVGRALKEGGIADIFSEEKVAGIFDSSVKAQAAGDLIAQITGELAKLSGERRGSVTSTDKTTTEQTQESGGLLGAIGGLF